MSVLRLFNLLSEFRLASGIPQDEGELLKGKQVVEAAGVEPASEKARYETTTCVSTSKLSGCALEAARKHNRSPIDLGLGLRTEAFNLSCKMTSTTQRTGSLRGTAT